MNVREKLYKCQPCLGRDPLQHGFLTHRGFCETGDDLADFATRETSSGQADFLGCTPPDTDWTHCAAGACGTACSQGNGFAVRESRFKKEPAACVFDRGGEFLTCRVPCPPWRRVFNLPCPLPPVAASFQLAVSPAGFHKLKTCGHEVDRFGYGPVFPTYWASGVGTAANSASSTSVATATRLSASSIRERSPASRRG